MQTLQPLQLRRLLLRSLTFASSHSSASSSGISSSSLNQQSRLLHLEPTSLSPHFTHLRPALSFLSLPRHQFSHSKPYSSAPTEQDSDQIAHSLSSELIKDSNSESLPITQRLELSFSHITLNPNLILSTLNLSPEGGRSVLGFNDWLISNPNFHHTDETLSYFIDYFGRRRDFKATHEILLEGIGITGSKTLESAIDRLVRAGRPTQAVSFFEKMEKEYGIKRDKSSLSLVVEKLCDKGHAHHAEKMVKDLANEFFPDETMCDMLIKGWCVDRKLDEAQRLVAEMYRGGFEIGPVAYNAMIDCVCKLCREKDPFRLQSEAEKVLVEMDIHGVPRNVETFNVLISHLCKIRKTEDAMNLFYRMGEWGCYPNSETFIVLIKSLYQAARIGEGDEMIDRMKSAGFGNELDKKVYFEFLKILCGIERIDHALSVFKKMKKDGCEVGIKTYDLLMGKLCAHNRLDKANVLYNEAQSRGVLMSPKAYKVDPRYVKKKRVIKKVEKKRETLPEKMVRKRRKLKQIRLSFVKKPKKMMRRAF